MNQQSHFPQKHQPHQQQFSQQPWANRFKKLGDEAETIFEQVADTLGWPFVRTGLNRPSIDMRKITKNACYTPDYMCEERYIEVQGFGKDRIFKLKDEKLDALLQWDMWIMQVDMFAWDNVTRRWGTCPIGRFISGDMPPNATGVYPEGKAWSGWTPEYLDIKWYNLDGADGTI